MMPIQRVVLAAAGGLLSLGVLAAEPARSGFYGGIAVRDQGSEQGVVLNDAQRLSRFALPLADGTASQSLAFGGYRWRNDLALEASLASVNGYRLPGRGGIGLVAPGGTGTLQRSWNVDLYGSWSFWPSLSLYGRLGYGQSDVAPVYSTSLAGPPDRRLRDGINYGVGVRYDLTRSLGLQLEYARVGVPGEAAGFSLPDADQVQFGLQFRF